MAFVPSPTDAPVRVLFSCTGLGIYNRGIESFFREAFDGLKGASGLEACLLKGAEDEGRRTERHEKVVFCLPRTGWFAPLIGRLTGRSAYAVEQWSSFPAVARQIRRSRPRVVFYSDSNLGFLLRRFRSQIGVPFRLLFSNGGPCHPPFDRHDFVQQVAPFYLEEALLAGEAPERHFMVPYGISVPSAPASDLAQKRALRQKLNVPLDRPVVLSVGWIARQHKRMHYVIEEVARMQEPRPFLQLLGAMDEQSCEIVNQGNHLLKPENFSARSVPYAEVGDYYETADCFVLGSLQEGFGRVYLEALMHGLPTIGHRHPVIEYVLGDVGITADLNQAGNLAPLIQEMLQHGNAETLRRARWESVRERFSWPVLAPRYREMFENCLSIPLSANPLEKA